MFLLNQEVNFMRNMGEAIKELRLESHLSQEQFGKMFNVVPSAVGMWENNKRVPSKEILESIADYFNVDMNFLYGKTSTGESSLKETGERIRNRRIKLGISQADLAKKIGYSNRSSLIRLEKGEMDPSQSKMVALAKALYTTPNYLMGWKDNQENPDNSNFLEIYINLVNSDELTALFDKAKDLDPRDIEAVLVFVQMLRKQRGIDD